MNTSIDKFIEILAENDYKAKYNDIPEDFDNRDEYLAEIHADLDEGGFLPDSLRYFELNDKANASDLTKYLLQNFQQFKIEFHANNHGNNDLFQNELLLQLDLIKKDIEQALYESKQLKDETLIEMLEAKFQMCCDVSEFIMEQRDRSEQTPSRKKPQERRSFEWLKEKDIIKDFYEKMKKNKLIAEDTDINDFVSIFSNIPVSEIKKPVQWEKGAKLFAYFFNKLMAKGYIPQKPSWIILEYCFTYNRKDKGIYVPIEKGVKSNVTDINSSGAPQGDELIDVLFP